MLRKVGQAALPTAKVTIQIPLSAGTYHLQFQALGFARREIKVTIAENHDEALNVELKEVLFKIREVRVYSGGEDPAYAMMRKAIGLAPYYLRQASSYEAEVYLRGSFILEKVPKILGKKPVGQCQRPAAKSRGDFYRRIVESPGVYSARYL
jgi:hypothetical protein